jgi:hypothetical protein
MTQLFFGFLSFNYDRFAVVVAAVFAHAVRQRPGFALGAHDKSLESHRNGCFAFTAPPG